MTQNPALEDILRNLAAIAAEQTGKPPAPSPPKGDPRSIADWDAAEVYISELAAYDPTYEEKIKALIAAQDEKLNRWMQLKHRITRDHNRRKREENELIAKMPPSVRKTMPRKVTKEVYEKRMQEYHTTLHKKWEELERENCRALAKWSVPFFCTRPGVLGEEDLNNHQKKMLDHLFDLFGKEPEVKDSVKKEDLEFSTASCTQNLATEKV
ncbi:hypothetical protein M011DRAFT_479340 [Sporormia fimetaria CBS 119925]|uniref:Uncharacterized protein n=1 Tax=Sporormia fimetaria CBS 119925 TaxID=1340428 RepID=A0A6A6V654_9PLEO|nr:hypothetical protein M011DRAFT_479340 [Sporormia fimetaria CBS 119925]